MSERTLLLTDATGQSFRFPLAGNRIQVGNSPRCDVRIDEPAVEFTLLRDGHDFIVINKSQHTIRGRGLKVLTGGTAAWKCGVEARIGRNRFLIEGEAAISQVATPKDDSQRQASLPLIIITAVLSALIGLRTNIESHSANASEPATRLITSMMATIANEPRIEWKQELLTELSTCKLALAERDVSAVRSSLADAAALCRAASFEKLSPDERELCSNIEQLAARNL